MLTTTDLTTLKYVEPAAMGSGEEPKLVTTTIQEHDSSQLQSQYKSQLMGVAMMGFMHIYLKYTNPLLIQSILPIKSALESNLIKVHIFGKPAAGDLKRPWKAGGGMMGMGQGAPVTDKASVEAAERAGRGGAKEE
jgi:Phosphate transport (Pho88)